MATYKMDPAHSEINFKVKHLMITNLTGTFGECTATMESQKDDFSDASVKFEAMTSSVDTGNDQRDTHLKSDDFFNAEKYPTLTFASTGIKKLNDNEYKLDGDLTIRDITKPIELDVEYNGAITDPYGQQKFGFELNGKISRKEFGLKWNAVTDTGGFVVGDEVKLVITVQMIKQV